MSKIFYKMMNIEDRIKTLVMEIVVDNVKAKAFGRLADAYGTYADRKEAYAEELKAECGRKDEEIVLLKSRIEEM